MSASYPSLGVRYLILNVSKCLGLGICLNEVRKLSFYNKFSFVTVTNVGLEEHTLLRL